MPLLSDLDSVELYENVWYKRKMEILTCKGKSCNVIFPALCSKNSKAFLTI